MPVATSTAILIAAGVAAGSSAYFGKEASDRAGEAKDKQNALEAQRRKQLADEAATREAARLKAETSGQRAGTGSRAAIGSALGFGSGDTKPGLGSGTLFGN